MAIVGIGCRYPGGVRDPDSFWQLVVQGQDAITEIPRDRLDLDHYYDARPATPGRIMSRWGGYLEGIDQFDPLFFNLSPQHAERLDPQQRLVLETAWEALEDAGQNVAALKGSRTGVFVGQWIGDFESRLFSDPDSIDFPMTLGSGRYAASGRLSYVLGLRGASLTIDAACSSSLAAVHLAVRSIRDGDSSLALAGGVNIILAPYIHLAYSQSRMMAPDGRCKFGDASGDGYVRSEGAGMVVLKPLDVALSAGDRIYAVIRGSSVNNDGDSSGSMGRPSRIGQEELLRAAYADAGIDPAQLAYIEAHGTGTRAGDPVELDSLAMVLREGRPAAHRGYVGSVKTNFGHTEAAAGVAGLIKAALVLHHREIPPSLHLRNPNPNVAWDALPFTIPTSRQPWPEGLAALAGVSSYGIGGTNAHVALEAAPQAALQPTAHANSRARLLALSARSGQALQALAAAYASKLEAADAPSLNDLCANAALQRTPMEHRAAFCVESRADLLERLRRFAAGETAAAQATGVAMEPRRRRVAFVFSGQGSQWVGMARELMKRESVFAQALAQCDSAMRSLADWSLIDQLSAEPGSSDFRMDDTSVMQPVLLAVEIALGVLWRHLGVEPEAVVGHSLGEVGAAHFAGALSLEEAMAVICRRSALMRQVSGKGAMAVVELSMDEMSLRLLPYEGRVCVGVSNAPRSCVMSGDSDCVAALMSQLEREGIFVRPVKIDVASHSPHMDPLVPALVAALDHLAPRATRLDLYSTVAAARVEGTTLGAAYWGQNLRRPVLFGQTIETMLAQGIDTFIELSPHPLLVGPISQVSKAVQRPALALQSMRRQEPEQQTLLASFGALYAAGYPVDWCHLFPGGFARVDLPKYPWQRERYWVRQAQTPVADEAAVVKRRELEAKHRPLLHRWRWQVSDSVSRRPIAGAEGPWVLVTDNALLAGVVARLLRQRGHASVTVAPRDLAGTLESLTAVPPQAVVLFLPQGMDAAYAPVAAIQACSVFAELVQPKLWLVTRGAQAIDGQPRPVTAEQGAAWGAGRVVAEEHPGSWGGMIDLDPEDADFSQSAAQLIEELLGPDGEDQIAWRAGSRFVPRMSALDETERAAVAPSLRSDGAYLITGGLGGIGSIIAQSLVARGARRLVLLGRSPLPARRSWHEVASDSAAGRRIATVRALETAGASVHVLAADVADSVSLERALAEYKSDAWPPIVGIIHAAGVIENKLALEMDRATFDRVMRPKFAGAQALEALLPEADLFVAFSSISATIGIPGMSNYAAANSGLDAIAAARRARGRHGLSIQWGPWAGTGMWTGEYAERNSADLARQGIQPLQGSDGAALFDWLLGFPASTVMGMVVDWEKFRSACSARNRRLLTGGAGESVALASAARGSAGAFLARMAAAESPHARRQMLESAVLDTAAQVLQVAPKKLDTRRTLGSMGLDSLLAVELRSRLETLLQRPLSATLAWNYRTVEALTNFLGVAVDGSPAGPLHTVAGHADAPASAAEAAHAQTIASEVEFDAILSLSDEDIARQLRGPQG